MDDSTRPAVLMDALDALRVLLDRVAGGDGVDLEATERLVREGVLAVGARVLEAGLAARGTGKDGVGQACACGGTAGFEGYRTKEVQTVVGWITLRRAYYWCPACGQGACPLDPALGLGRASHSPGVRRATGHLGALLPFAQAATTLATLAGIRVSASTVRTVTEAIGARREAELAQTMATAWRDGLPPAAGPAPARLYVAMDGVRILGTGGEGKEVKVGVVAAGAWRAGRGAGPGGGQLRRRLRAGRGVRPPLSNGGPSPGAGGSGGGRRAGRRGRVDLEPGRRALSAGDLHRGLVPRQRADLGVGAGAPRRGDGQDAALGRAPAGPAGRRAGALPSSRPGAGSRARPAQRRCATSRSGTSPIRRGGWPTVATANGAWTSAAAWSRAPAST